MSVRAVIHTKVLDEYVEIKQIIRRMKPVKKIQQNLFLKYATISGKRGYADRHERRQLLYRSV